MFWESPKKILVQEVRNVHLPQRIVACYDEEGFIGLNTTNVIIPSSSIESSLLYLMAIISSKLINEYFRVCFVDNHIATQYLQSIPIRRIIFSTPDGHADKLFQDGLNIINHWLDGTDGVSAQLYKTFKDSKIGFWLAKRLTTEPEQSDIVHNVLVHLASQMIMSGKQKQVEVNRIL